MHRPVAVALLPMALVLASCGSASPEGAAQQLAERAMERATGEDVDIDFDLDEEGGGIRIATGAGEMAMGDDLPRPDWLPAGFPIPDGAKITYSVNDVEAGQAALGGDTPGTLEQARSGYLAAMDAFGARRLESHSFDDRSLVWEIPDGRVAEIALLSIEGGGVQFTLAIHVEEDLERFEREVAGPRDSVGRAVAVVDGETFGAQGNCQIDPSYANFGSTGSPTEPQISVAVQGSSVGGTVTLTDADGNLRIWILSEDGTSVGRFDDSSISASGTALNLMTGEVDIPISIDVTCD